MASQTPDEEVEILAHLEDNLALFAKDGALTCSLTSNSICRDPSGRKPALYGNVCACSSLQPALQHQ